MKLSQSIAARWIYPAIDWVKAGSPAPVNRRTQDSERRRKERVKTSFQAVLSMPGGAQLVRGVDLNQHGAGVISPIPLAVGSVMFIEMKATKEVGFAHVRHCTPRGKGFAAGLEFPAELMAKEAGAWRYQRISAS